MRLCQGQICCKNNVKLHLSRPATAKTIHQNQQPLGQVWLSYRISENAKEPKELKFRAQIVQSTCKLFVNFQTLWYSYSSMHVLYLILIL